MNKIKNKFIEKQLYLLAGLIFFLYSWGVGAFVQLYLTPKIFPEASQYHNLVVFDSRGFDQIARIKAAEINETGWTAWELRPETFSPAGIASIFYVIFTDEPYSVLPYNALLHALSGCIVLWLLLRYFFWLPAIIGSLFFVLNPSSLEWVTQIHRDGLFVLGNLMLLMSMVILSKWRDIDDDHNMWSPLFLSLAGIMLVWVARPYWMYVFIVTTALWLMVYFVSIYLNDENINCKTNKIIKVFTLSMIIFSAQVYLLKYHMDFTFGSELPVVDKLVVDKPVVDKPVVDKPVMEDRRVWIDSKVFPDFIEKYFNRLYSIRLDVLDSGGNSLIDKDVPMNSMESYFTYFPRALQVGFLSPLPNLWSGEGSTPAMTIARKVMGIIALFFYIFLLGFLIMIIKNRTDFNLWVVTGFCLIGMLVYTYGYPNVGTLMRFRYTFHTLLMSIGVAQIISMVALWREKKMFF